MNYWRGFMDWPIDRDWVCETCGEYAGLIWGIVHARCRCDRCHTEYQMRDEQGDIVTKPISQLKPEYKEAAKRGWEKFKKPIDEFTDDEWESLKQGVTP